MHYCLGKLTKRSYRKFSNLFTTYIHHFHKHYCCGKLTKPSYRTFPNLTGPTHTTLFPNGSDVTLRLGSQNLVVSTHSEFVSPFCASLLPLAIFGGRGGGLHVAL